MLRTRSEHGTVRRNAGETLHNAKPLMSDINAAISEFLATKGIEAYAPESSRLGRAAAVGAITALTPIGGLAYGAVKARSNQGEAMAWQSWQQWVLSQPDWPEFYANEWPRLKAERQKKEDQARERALQSLAAERKVAMKILIPALFLIVCGVVVSEVHHGLTSQESYSEQVR